MDRETLQDGVTDRSFDGAQDNGPADDQTPPQEMDPQAVSLGACYVLYHAPRRHGIDSDARSDRAKRV